MQETSFCRIHENLKRTHLLFGRWYAFCYLKINRKKVLLGVYTVLFHKARGFVVTELQYFLIFAIRLLSYFLIVTALL